MKRTVSYALVLALTVFSAFDGVAADRPRKPQEEKPVTVQGWCSNPPPTPTIVTPAQVCPNSTGNVAETQAYAGSYYWSIDNGIIEGSPGSPSISYTAGASGYVTLSVYITDVEGCSNGSSMPVPIVAPATPTVTPDGVTTFCSGGSVALTSSSETGNQWYDGEILLVGETNQTYVAFATGSYNVVVTEGGCSSEASASTFVMVHPIPSTPTITPGGSTTFCAGGSVTLNSSSATGNQWYLGGNPISGATNQAYVASAPGNYTVVVTTNGCSSVPSSATSVTVNPIPPNPTIGGATSFCEGGSVTLTSSSATGNQWYRNGVLLSGETAQTHIATTAGAYTVRVTSSGCTSGPSLAKFVTVNPKPDATITVVSPMFSGASSTASVDVPYAGATLVWSITGGTITSGAGTSTITFIAGAAGTLTLGMTVTTIHGCTDTKSVNVTVQSAPFGAPSSLRATGSGTTSANLTWASVLLADHYEIHRSPDNVNWTLRGTSATPTFSEGGLTASTTYFYKVRAIKADTTPSAFSAIDPATTVVFTDDPIAAFTTISKTTHITQLRTAANIARASVGLAAFTFTDPTLTAASKVKAIHLTELRSALVPVLSAISVTPAYTDPAITAGVTKAKGTHIHELRDQIR
ncbi:MAG TPA: hypothetical protein VFV49_17885 [Thermoanaerobaculia bacterium]|nr:hypothetical protein [Thermoanaerobaculia bacterium]